MKRSIAFLVALLGASALLTVTAGAAGSGDFVKGPACSDIELGPHFDVKFARTATYVTLPDGSTQAVPGTERDDTNNLVVTATITVEGTPSPGACTGSLYTFAAQAWPTTAPNLDGTAPISSSGTTVSNGVVAKGGEASFDYTLNLPNERPYTDPNTGAPVPRACIWANSTYTTRKGTTAVSDNSPNDPKGKPVCAVVDPSNGGGGLYK